MITLIMDACPLLLDLEGQEVQRVFEIRTTDLSLFTTIFQGF
jgi:hypothetical protein